MNFIEHKKNDDPNSIWSNFFKERKLELAKCKKCAKIIKTGGGSTSGLHQHMKTMHDINFLKRNEPSTSSASSDNAVSLFDKTVVSATKITKYFKNTNDNSLAVILARMTALDGLPFRVFITSKDLRRSIEALKLSDKLPQSANTIQKIVMDYSKYVRESVMVPEFTDRRTSGNGFSITWDEWTSKRNRRYMNINLHSDSKFWNLGLVRIQGKLPATKCVQLLQKKLSEYNLSLEKNIVCVTNDGASVMKKVGTLIPVHQQLCLAHGIQLAVISVLYRKYGIEEETNIPTETNEDVDTEVTHSASDESDADDNEDGISMEYQTESKVDITNIELADLIKKIRKVIKIFRFSPLKNETLQRYVLLEFGKEFCLILDCRTRWNSLIAMLERFYMLKSCIKKSIIDLEIEITISDVDFNEINLVISALLPVKLAVEAICREDANLITADTTILFMFDALDKLKTSLSIELLEALKKRISERRAVLSDVINYLHKGLATEAENLYFPKVSKTALMRYISALVSQIGDKKLADDEHQIVEDSEDEEEEIVEIHSMKDRLNRAIKDNINFNIRDKKAQDPKDVTTSVKKEITLFDAQGTRGVYLQQAYDLLLTVKPTSVEAERAFSSAGVILNKLRTRLNDKSLDALCFLRGHFKNLKK